MNFLSCIPRRSLGMTPPPTGREAEPEPEAAHCLAMDAYIGRIIALLLEASGGHAGQAGIAQAEAQQGGLLVLPAHALFEGDSIDTATVLASMREADVPFDAVQYRRAFVERVQRQVAALPPSQRERAYHAFRHGRLSPASYRPLVANAADRSMGATTLGICLSALEDALLDMASAPLPGTRQIAGSMPAYTDALDRFLHALSTCPADAGQDTVAQLAGLLDAAIAAGGAAVPDSDPAHYDELVRQRLIEMEPEAFRCLTALACAPYDPAAPAQLPLRLVASAKAERRIAARELSKIFRHARDLASRAGRAGPTRTPPKQLGVSNYAVERAALALPVLTSLLTGLRSIDEDRGRAFVRAADCTCPPFRPHAMASRLKTPWFPAETAASLEAAIRLAAALFRHGDGWPASLPPALLDECKETLRHELAMIRDIVSTVAQGHWNEDAPMPTLAAGPSRFARMGPASEALAGRAASVTDVLHRAKEALDGRATALLAAAPPSIPALVQQIRANDAAARAQAVHLVGQFIADTRVISDIAHVTGLQGHAAGLRERAEQMVTLVADCGHLLPEEQLQALRGCTGLGIPVGPLCAYAQAVRESLASCMEARETARFVQASRALANAIIALQHCALAAQAPDEPAAGRAATHRRALDKLRPIIEDGLRRMDARQMDRIITMVGHREFRYCLSTASELLEALDHCLGDVADWCDTGVVADLEVALRAVMTIPQLLADVVMPVASRKGKGRLELGPRRPATRHGVAMARMYEAAWGVLVRNIGCQCRIVGLNNVEFYSLHAAIPRRAVVSDYRPEGHVLERCSKTLLDRRTLTKGDVNITFPGQVTDSGSQESFVINLQLWLDIHRAGYLIDDIQVNRALVASAREASVRTQANKENDLTSENPYLYRLLAALRRLCAGKSGSRLHRQQMHWVSSLLGQTMAAAVTTLGTRRAIHYGWLGGGLLLKPHNKTTVEYVFSRPDRHSETAKITMSQCEFPTAISLTRERDGSAGGCRQLQSGLSRAFYQLSVDFIGRRPTVRPGALLLRYAFVSEDI